MTWTIEDLPPVRGRYSQDAIVANFTWFRVGGPADIVYSPADEDDLAAFFKELDPAIPVFAMGVGSNVLMRDGGFRGVIIRLGSGFNAVEISGTQVEVGAAVLDAQLAKQAGRAGISGLEFYRGIPGTIGGALAMNAGAYGVETKDVLREAAGITRAGERVTLSTAEMGFSYRHCRAADEGIVFVRALYEGVAGDPAAIEARMAEIMAAREASQPIKERTGGSTFANPDPAISGGRKSWQLVEAVGGRGRVVGDAQISQQHCNFLINRGNATAADLEQLGEGVRAEILAQTGVDLRWEIKRIGEAP